ncbi:malate synthase G [Marinococcus sp. PL1-022]|uniref:malate synthase G n=1 Tax=Marinococcus sp. PL1-022 TaxID=3095363 RepID=UPI0029C495A7|nr:malate synthase G [Marinococcus sp. PL1-022]MDX6151499.1 malate synthase G [Marinococcus sp. PL1-022]
MNTYRSAGRLHVHPSLYQFINEEVLPGSGLEQKQFWQDFGQIVHDLTPENEVLLHTRDNLQNQIHEWHQAHPQRDPDQYRTFLERIGYLEPEPDDFQIATEHTDEEISMQAGPQLVVPISNERFAINAANARWGSLYDALYGSDIINEEDGAEQQQSYNPVRGEKVVAYAKQFLDEYFPLRSRSHKDAVSYSIENGGLEISFQDGSKGQLQHPEQFSGYQGASARPVAVLLKHHRLHIEIQIDYSHPIGKTDPAGVKDVAVESALTTIMDCEDSVAAVDAEDKILVYRNWLGLIKGDINARFQKGDKTVTRIMNPDRSYTSPFGEEFTLSGRSLMLNRNVGHLMTTDAILNEREEEIPEGIMDGVITSLISKHDLLGNGKYGNSREGSIYIVKPKMHGSKEAAFANKLFDRIEDMLHLERHTLKIGVMDEERRTTINLKACIREVKDRVMFINTGFLDRTGDEIHTSMEAGAMIRKGEMKTSAWLGSYEKSNVQTGLATGFEQRAQIGKGMWAMPEQLAAMMDQKDGQLKAGASTAWVPSPTAATLHALHYHQVDVPEVQKDLKQLSESHLDSILTIPTAANADWSEAAVQEELDNNAQGILGYVVRWVELGIGCSKVPDINNVALMEDRATLRISSQHIANWLHHHICSRQQVMETFKRMAAVVDEQNAHDPEYRPMSPDFDQSTAFQAACDLVFQGYNQPNGYTEPILHRRRREAKDRLKAEAK